MLDLPPPPPAAAPDPLRRLWGPITVRVAWELLRAGIQVRPATLRAARDHAVWRMPAGVGLAEAEALASASVDDYLGRCNGRYAPFVRDPDLDILPVPAWREAITDSADPIHEAVFRLHYADGLPLEEVERRTQLDAVLLRAGREAVRELTRAVLAEEGVSLDGWDPARLDRLVSRIATAAGDACPGPGGLATEHGRAHADTCPRCSRALRLLREGVVSPGDLFAPEEGGCVPSSTVDLVAIGFHPDVRRHVRALARMFGAAARLLADDVLLVNASAEGTVVEPVDLAALERRQASGRAPERVQAAVHGEEVSAVLADAAERGAPPAARLRVLRARVPGRWAPRAVLGPGIDGMLTTLQSMAWGEVVGIPPLPEPLPPPPSAARWWMGAGLMALLAIAAAVVALGPDAPPALVSLDVDSDAAGITFDTDDNAWVEVIVLHGQRPEVAFHSDSPADKARLATGDGRYRLSTSGDAVVVLASPNPVDGLERVLQGPPEGNRRPADTLSERLRDRYAGAAVVAVP